MRAFFAGCLGAAWLQFCHNVAARRPQPDQEPPTTEDQARTERILARCEAERRACGPHRPEIVARWVEFADNNDVPIVVADRNQAIVPHRFSAPRRVH